MKLQAPTSKLQRNVKLQYPKERAARSLLEFGAWMLELGIFAVKKRRMLVRLRRIGISRFPIVQTILLSFTAMSR